MTEYGGLRPTGRQSRDPAAQWIELESEDGYAHVALVFDAAHRGHPTLAKDVELVLSFLEFPMVTGVADLSWYDIGRATFVYPTGTVWSLHEILRTLADRRETLGPRAALELATLGAEILVEAADTGGLQGCFSHGNLNPWRLALRDDGELQVVGYGLPQVELARRRADPAFALTPDSLRWCPPERLLGMPEGVTSDTYALALLAFEGITGRPLYAGQDVAALTEQVRLSEGVQLLAKPPADLPRPIAECLSQALIFDPDTRLGGADFAAACRSLLAQTKGRSLAEVMAVIAASKPQQERPRRKLLTSQPTSTFTRADLAALQEEDDPADTPAASARPALSGRWAAPSRRAVPTPAPSPDLAAPTADGTGDASAMRRLRRDTPDTPAAPAELPQLRRRLRRPDEPEVATTPGGAPEPPPVGGAPDVAAAVVAPPPPPDGAADLGPRRLLRREAPAEPEGGLRRRLRRDGEP
jgi:hypothetical protein